MLTKEEWEQAFNPINFKNATVLNKFYMQSKEQFCSTSEITFLSPKKAVKVRYYNNGNNKKVYRGNKAIDCINAIADSLIPFSDIKLFKYDKNDNLYKSVFMFKEEAVLYDEVKIDIKNGKIQSIEMFAHSDDGNDLIKKALYFIY